MFSVLLLCLGLNTMWGWDQPSAADLEKRWRAEYPEAAAKLEATARNIHAKGKYTYRALNGDVSTSNSLTVAATGQKRLFVRDQRTLEASNPKRQQSAAEVMCETEEYSFFLSKKDPSSSYLIDAYEPYVENDESDFNYWYKQFARASTVFFGTSILKRMQDPTFSLVSIEQVDDNEDKIVKINYTYEGKYVQESGWFNLDPSRNWAIRKVDAHCVSKKENGGFYDVQGEAEYETLADGEYFPRRSETFIKTSNPNYFDHFVVSYNDIKFGNVSEDLFKLTAYGLPNVPLRAVAEPTLFTFRNPYLWLALASAVISFTMLRYLRK